MRFEDFLTADQEQEVVKAISLAEKNTSGEIRLHLDRKCSTDPVERAKKLFFKLDMHKTQFRNGVLIYIAIDDQITAIYGDQGIHEAVGQNFWEHEISIMTTDFRKGGYLAGIIKCINLIGEKLKEQFPYDDKGDINELDNEISFDS